MFSRRTILILMVIAIILIIAILFAFGLGKVLLHFGGDEAGALWMRQVAWTCFFLLGVDFTCLVLATALIVLTDDRGSGLNHGRPDNKSDDGEST